MVFLGNGCGLHIPIEEQKEGQLLYRKYLKGPKWWEYACGINRCCDSYLVSNKGAYVICEYINNVVKKNNDKKLI